MKTWLKRLGVAGFAFFFIKGMLWLTIPAAIVVFRGCGTERPPADEPAQQAAPADQQPAANQDKEPS